MSDRLESTITLRQHYMLFSKLRVKDIKYEDIPLEVDGMEIDMQAFFSVLQKEIYAHSAIWVN